MSVLQVKEKVFSFREKSEVLIFYGFCPFVYRKVMYWLQSNKKRRIFFFLEEEESISDEVQKVPQVKIFFRKPFDVSFREMAWESVFLKCELIDLGSNQEAFASFGEKFTLYHRGADLLLSDAADWGALATKNMKALLGKPLFDVRSLKGAFRGIPAVLIGAGPSLKKALPLLKELKSKALIFAGGSALKEIDFMPHFSASIDSAHAFSRKHVNVAVPHFLQPRAHPSAYEGLNEALILAPDSHFSHLNWMFDLEEGESFGWTVGNFLMKIAHDLGCTPIYFVGMDYTYVGGQKYPSSTPLKKNPEMIDWDLAVQWTEEFAQKHLETTFINCKGEGVSFSDPIQETDLDTISWEKTFPIDEQVRAALSSAKKIDAHRFMEWKESLKRAKILSCKGNLALLEEEICYQQLLLPLWNLWKWVFLRELALDRKKFSFEEKVFANQMLFFQTVLEEHLKL